MAITSRSAAASIPSRVELVRDDPDADHEVVADALAHGLEHLAGEAGAALEIAAVAVGARVVEGREELVQQIAVRHVHLDTVEAALDGDLGGIRPCIGELSDVGAGHLPGGVRRRRRQHARRRIYRARSVGTVGIRLRTVVVELDEDARAGLMDRVGHAAIGFDRLGAECVFEPADGARGVHELVARDEQPAPSLGSPHEVGGLAVGLDAVGVLLGMGGLQNAIGHGDAADSQRSEKG